MRFVDCHSHTLHYSTDATQTVDDLLADAGEHRLAGICLTDHYDKDISYEQGVENIFNLEHYFRHLQPLRERTASDPTRLFIGIELGWMPYLTELYTEIVQDWPFDSITLSLHAMDYDQDICVSPGIYHDGIVNCYSRALSQMIDMMQAIPDFTILGHYDYVSRYVPSRVVRMDYQPLADEFDAVFRHLIAHGKALELNTRTTMKFQQLGVRGAAAWPDPAIFRRYRELGGELVALSSDSHQIGQAATLFPDAVDFLTSAGFRQVVHFENRLPVFTSLVV